MKLEERTNISDFLWFSGKFVRFLAYASLVFLFSEGLFRHWKIAAHSSLPEQFVVAIDYALFDIAVISVLLLSFFLAIQTYVTYRRWVVVGILLLIVAFAAPEAMRSAFDYFRAII